MDVGYRILRGIAKNGVSMKAFFGVVLIFISLNVFAEDVYDRINECQKKDDYKDCVFNILRELANQKDKPRDESIGVKSSDKDYTDTDLCVLTKTSLNTEILHKGLPSDHERGFADWINKKQLHDLQIRWKNLGCDARSKVKCELDGISININSKAGYVWLYAESDLSLKEMWAELQEFLCL
jgi:hypothetical protein